MKESVIKGVFLDEVAAQDLVAGTYPEYFDVRSYVRPDFRIEQAAGANDSISFKVYVSFDQIGSTPLENLGYDDIGLAFYSKDPFDDALEFLIDNGLKLQGASAVKIVFTVAGSANDSSYSIKATLVKSNRVLCGRC